MVAATLDYEAYVNRYADLREYARLNGMKDPTQLRLLGEQHYTEYGQSEGRAIAPVVSEKPVDKATQSPDIRIIESPKTATSEPASVASTTTKVSAIKDALSDINPALLYTFAGLAALIVLKG